MNSERPDDSLEIAIRDEIQRGPLLVDEEKIRRIAKELCGSVRQRTPESLAKAAGCVIRYKPNLPSELESALLPSGTILLRPSDDPQRVRLRACHEIAHWLLREAVCSSADVGRLALLLVECAHSATKIAE